MSNNLKLLENYHREVIKIYKEKNLDSLRGIRNEYKIDGNNILTWRSEAVKPYREDNDFDFYKNESDTFLVSDELWYFTANTFLYLPHINNPLKDGYQFENGKKIFPNIQNVYSLKFDIYSAAAIEKLYNYWDRIGDLIAACIPTGLSERRIYFASVIDNIEEEYRAGENFNWLKDFKNDEYKEMNAKRRNIVHYQNMGTEFKMDHLDSPTDEEQIKELFKERTNIPTYLKKAIDSTIEGYQKTLDYLIDMHEV